MTSDLIARNQRNAIWFAAVCAWMAACLERGWAQTEVPEPGELGAWDSEAPPLQK